MAAAPFRLFLYLSKLIHLQNPVLLLREYEDIPLSFCSGKFFPVTCSQYDASSSDDIEHVSGHLRYEDPQSKAQEHRRSNELIYT